MGLPFGVVGCCSWPVGRDLVGASAVVASAFFVGSGVFAYEVGGDDQAAED